MLPRPPTYTQLQPEDRVTLASLKQQGLGIGHPGVKSEMVGWVLKKPLKEHRDAIDDAIARSLHAVPALLAGDTTRAMQQIHTRV